MTLDLSELVTDWDESGEEIPSRVVTDAQGGEWLQLRVDLGVLQMQPSGRPDGRNYHSHTSVLDYIRHERSINGLVSESDWDELRRELEQFNFRRLTLAGVAEHALRDENEAGARGYLERAVLDIEHCLNILALARKAGVDADDDDLTHSTPISMLVFNRARMRVRLCVIDQRYEDAIEETQRGADELRQSLSSERLSDEEIERDPGLSYLNQLIERLRKQHGISSTLREKLNQAIEQEDFERAAALRDQLRRRSRPGDEICE